MSERNLTYEQAQEIRGTRERTGASCATLGYVYGVSHQTVWKIIKNLIYTTPERSYGPHSTPQPTPHDELTYEGWHRNTTPLPPLEAIHNDYRAIYAAQNERDGIQRDPAMRAWLFYGADWATDEAIAAD